MLSVGDSIANDVLKEHLENTTSLLVDEPRDTLDTTTASQTPDSGLGNTLRLVSNGLGWFQIQVGAQDTAVWKSASTTQPFALFPSTRQFRKDISSLSATYLDVISQDLAVALGTALAQSLATLAASRHVEVGYFGVREAERAMKDL